MADKLFIIGIFIGVGGLASLGFGYATDQRDKILKQWPSTDGTILTSEIVRTTQALARSPAHSVTAPTDPGYRYVNVWALDVEYRYRVNGQQYTGKRATANLIVERIWKEDQAPSPDIRRLQAQMPVSANLPVHYDSSNPRDSYVIYTESPGKLRLFRTGSILLVIGVLVAIASKLAQ